MLNSTIPNQRLFPKHNRDGDLSKKYLCECCSTIVYKKVYEGNNHICPKCSQDQLNLMKEEVSIDERRLLCPKCYSNFPHERLVTECFMCGSLLEEFSSKKRKG